MTAHEIKFFWLVKAWQNLQGDYKNRGRLGKNVG